MIGAALVLVFLFVVAVIAWRATRRPPPAAPTPAALPVVIAPLAGSAPSPLPEHLLPRLATGAAAGAAQQPDTAAATFEGRVVSSATGARIPGADLTFSRGGGAASVYAGADGAFRFDAPTEGRWLLAAVMAPGFLPFAPEWGHSPVELDARAGRHVTGIEIHLAPATTVIGRVLDRSGNPIAGATAGCGSHPDHAARTARRSGFSVRSIAASHRSLRATARNWMTCSPLSSFHLAPGRFIRTSTRLLQVASTLPLPTGRPRLRAAA